MTKDFEQIEWGPACEDDLRQLVRLAVREDLDRQFDWTTVSLVPESAIGSASIVSRESGVVCGIVCVESVLDELDCKCTFEPQCEDGSSIAAETPLGVIHGPVRELLVVERLILNLLGHLSGIASLTMRYVQAIAGTSASIYDTRKTTPGYRRLEKYAVRCGGARNHRIGLNTAVLIKDNHLAFGSSQFTPAQAVQKTREFLDSTLPSKVVARMMIEIEVDSLAQLENVLPAQPDIVLLDNMTPSILADAVRIRDHTNPQVGLEASGGIHLQTVRSVAESGVDRISVGAITHSARNLDVGLDWN